MIVNFFIACSGKMIEGDTPEMAKLRRIVEKMAASRAAAVQKAKQAMANGVEGIDYYI